MSTRIIPSLGGGFAFWCHHPLPLLFCKILKTNDLFYDYVRSLSLKGLSAKSREHRSYLLGVVPFWDVLARHRCSRRASFRPTGACLSMNVFSHGSRRGLRSSAALRLNGRGVDSAERDRKGGRDRVVQLSKTIILQEIYLRQDYLACRHAVNRKTGWPTISVPGVRASRPAFPQRGQKRVGHPDAGVDSVVLSCSRTITGFESLSLIKAREPTASCQSQS